MLLINCNAMRNDLINLYPQLYNTSSVIYNPIPSNIEDFVKKSYNKTKKRKLYFMCRSFSRSESFSLCN